MPIPRVLMRRFTVSAAILTFYTAVAFGWGQDGHRIINQSFTIHHPVDSLWFARFTQYYVIHASDADYRKNDSKPYGPTSEYPRHFMDIDAYSEFHAGWFPHDLDSLITKYGQTVVYNNGVLPWAIKSDYDSLVTFLRMGDSTNANRIIADLGHYIGDAFQPLHCTQDYNRNGVHSRYESTMLHDFLAEISIKPDTARYISDVLNYAFRGIYRSNSHIQEIFNADDQAKSLAGNTSSSLYYQTMWTLLDSMTISQLQDASVSLASLVYSAWVDANSSTSIREADEMLPLTFYVSEPYPNPFNPSTTIEITVPQASSPSSALISVCSVTGSIVKTEELNLRPGSNYFPLSFASLSSGAYFVVVYLQSNGLRVRHSVKALLLK